MAQRNESCSEWVILDGWLGKTKKFFWGLKRKVAQNGLKHALILEFFKIKWCVSLAYFRSHGLFKISKYIEMYWKLMFKTDRTTWKMYLLPSDWAYRCFRVFCRWVILGGWPGGGSPRKKKVAQNLLKHALVLEFLKSGKKFFFWVKKFTDT